jgi:hypothetical protein
MQIREYRESIPVRSDVGVAICGVPLQDAFAPDEQERAKKAAELAAKTAEIARRLREEDEANAEELHVGATVAPTQAFLDRHVPAH